MWNSPAGENVYMTLLLLKPPVEPVKASSLPLVMGLSVAQAVRDITGISAGIKWPNDVVAAGKKICGICQHWCGYKYEPEGISGRIAG